jgi:hypothetical protein
MLRIEGQVMNYTICIGFLASALVLAAFGMKDMVQLRIVAMLSNVVFIAYGLELHLAPVWLLHVALLPMNAFRLWQVIRAMSTAPCPCPTMLQYFAQGPKQLSVEAKGGE